MKETRTSVCACSFTAFIVCVILIIINGIGSLNATGGESCSSCRRTITGESGYSNTWGCKEWVRNYHDHMDMWASWDNWSRCSRTCGGGVRTRYRYRCCDSGKSQECIEYSNCQELCLNSGTFDTQCRCTNEFFGICCEECKPTLFII